MAKRTQPEKILLQHEFDRLVFTKLTHIYQLLIPEHPSTPKEPTRDKTLISD